MGIGFGAVVGLSLADAESASLFIPDLYRLGSCALYNRNFLKAPESLLNLIYELPDRLTFLAVSFCLRKGELL